jgi:nucleotidyltransferase/DNA polymerase involved in DNA repair
MRVPDALKVCPDIKLVHVETVGSNTTIITEEHQNQEKFDRLTQKACLERYRAASYEILALLHKIMPNTTIEKASIDEFYMDVTADIQELVQQQAESGCMWGSIVVGQHHNTNNIVNSESGVRLGCAACIACQLRGAILEELGFTSSAGIAGNKLLAKIGSAMHKPNQQTVIPPGSIQSMMEELPLKKIGGFGGKVGALLEEKLGCTTAGQVQRLPRSILATHFSPDTVAFIEAAVRGVSTAPVVEKERPKSMLAAKSFNSTSSLQQLKQWIGILSTELAARMTTDEKVYNRRPKTFTLYYRTAGSSKEKTRSRPMPRWASNNKTGDGKTTTSNNIGVTMEQLAAVAWEVFEKNCPQDALPCTRLAIAGSDFQDLPSHKGITRFFATRSTAYHEEEKGKEEVGVVEEEKEEVEKQQPQVDTHNNKEHDDDDNLLNQYDVAEQKRIFKEQELLNQLKRSKDMAMSHGSGGASGSTEQQLHNKKAKTDIALFFTKK